MIRENTGITKEIRLHILNTAIYTAARKGASIGKLITLREAIKNFEYNITSFHDTYALILSETGISTQNE